MLEVAIVGSFDVVLNGPYVKGDVTYDELQAFITSDDEFIRLALLASHRLLIALSSGYPLGKGRI